MPLIYDGIDQPVEVGPGRGDLRYGSLPTTALATSSSMVALAGGKQISHAMLVATQPWIGAAITWMLGKSIRVPLKTYRRTGDDSRDRLGPADHPLAAAINRPWTGGSSADLVMALLGPVLVHGNSVTPVEDGAGEKIEFAPTDWRYCKPIKVFRDVISGWEIDRDSQELSRVVPSDTTLHIAYWSPLGPTGIAPLQQLGTTVNIEDAAQRWAKSTFANGARPPSAIQANEHWANLAPVDREAALANLRLDITSIYSGPDNGGKPALLPPGLEWKPIGHTAVEAALIEHRRVTREEIAAVFQIPPPLLGILDKSTFSNYETARAIGYTDSLGPPLVLIEKAFNAQIVRDLLREDDIYVEFDFSGVLRGDRLKEVESLREAVGTALLTPNEARAIDNRPQSPQDGMDDFYLPINNLGRVGGAGGSADRDTTADPASA